ncbi:MAG: TatA/E family twin arginine-targeting protein translocase [Bryobacteraceae bacterium]
MFTLGVPEMAVIFILALVLFGPKKLPELGRTIGKAMTEFRRASNDLKATFEREMHTLERENQSIQATTRQAVREIADQTYDSLPSDAMWNPLAQIHDEVHNEVKQIDAAFEASLNETPAIETATTQESFDFPAPVSASEVSGAESTPVAESPQAIETAAVETHVGIEGTIPRRATPEPPTNS